MKNLLRAVPILCLAAAACAGDSTGNDDPIYLAVPLTDLRTGKYGIYQGGLYPGGTNTPPAAHRAEGERRRDLIQPRDINGNPSANGRIVFLAVGIGHAGAEFCDVASYTECLPGSFVSVASGDPGVNPRISFINGARNGSVPADWDQASDTDYNRIRNSGLAPAGLSEAQVQVVWLKLANPTPSTSLPLDGADAFRLAEQLADAVRALHQRYPNLQQVYVSSRSYGGYSLTRIYGEPFAYQSGFAVKWLVESQIRQMEGAAPLEGFAPGDLRYPEAAPWIAWGPYLWADQLNVRSDGLFYERADFDTEGVLPSETGRQRISDIMFGFFANSPTTRCWFLASC